MPEWCPECRHARHVHATATSDWTGCRVLGCSCEGWPDDPDDEDDDWWRAMAP